MENKLKNSFFQNLICTSHMTNITFTVYIFLIFFRFKIVKKNFYKHCYKIKIALLHKLNNALFRCILFSSLTFLIVYGIFVIEHKCQVSIRYFGTAPKKALCFCSIDLWLLILKGLFCCFLSNLILQNHVWSYVCSTSINA